MSLKSAIICSTTLGLCLFSQARFCAAKPVALPQPKPAYFPLLLGPGGHPAILAHMDIAINPKGTTIQQVLSAYAGVHNKAAHPEWLAAKACQMLLEGRGKYARGFFGNTKAATALWKLYFASALSYKVYTTQVAYMGVPWEIKASPLVDVGWLVAPRAGQWTTGLMAQWKMLAPWWGVGSTVPLIFRRSRGRFKIQGGSIFIPGDEVFDGIALGLSFGEARPPTGQVLSLRNYIGVPFHVTQKSDQIATKGESVDFQIFFRLRPVPGTLLSEVRILRRAIQHPKKAATPAGGISKGQGVSKPDPFGPKTTDFLEQGRNIKPLWIIGAQSVNYALFSGEHHGKNQLWIMKLRRASTGFESYGFKAGLNRNICTDGLFGIDSSVTHIDRFLAKKQAGRQMDGKK